MTGRRIGVVLPDNNMVLEAELSEALQRAGATLRIERLVVEGTDPAALQRMSAGTDAALAALVDSGADAVLYACMSTSLIPPFTWDDEFCASAPRPAATAAQATALALRAVGAERVAVISSYAGAARAALRPFLARHGVTITADASLELDDLDAVGTVEPVALRELAAEALTEDAQALSIVGTDLPTRAAAAQLRNELGLPVVTTNEALFDAALRLLE
jgi:maleate isomerase